MSRHSSRLRHQRGQRATAAVLLPSSSVVSTLVCEHLEHGDYVPFLHPFIRSLTQSTHTCEAPTGCQACCQAPGSRLYQPGFDRSPRTARRYPYRNPGTFHGHWTSTMVGAGKEKHSVRGCFLYCWCCCLKSCGPSDRARTVHPLGGHEIWRDDLPDGSPVTQVLVK